MSDQAIALPYQAPMVNYYANDVKGLAAFYWKLLCENRTVEQ